MIEVVVAMFIISMSISLTATLFASVFGSSQQYLKQQAWFAMNQWVNDCRKLRDTSPLSKDFDVFVLEKTVVEENAAAGLWQIKFEAFSPQGKLLVYRTILLEAD